MKNGILIASSSAGLKSARKSLLKDGVIWGERLFTPSTFIKNFSGQEGPLISPLIEKVFVSLAIRRTALKYFESVKEERAVRGEFHKAIKLLKGNLITPEELEKDLETRGSLKEFDLLNVYKAYEEEFKRTGFEDEGDLLRSIIEKIRTHHAVFLDGIGRIAFDGFDPMPAGMSLLVEEINAHYPDIDTVIDSLNTSSIYEEKWPISCAVELHTCRSAGNECRFVCETIADLIDSGTSPEDIGIVISKNAGNAKEIILALSDRGLMPPEAVRCFEGLGGRIRKTVEDASSIDEISEALQLRCAEDLFPALNKGTYLPQITHNLNQLNSIFDDIFGIRGLNNSGLKIDDVKDILISETRGDARSYIDTASSPIEWIWWEDGAFPDCGTIFIPNCHQGGMPPQPAASIFFQETSFLPANAPSYFSALFPQPDTIKLREAARFKKYLECARKRAFLSFSRVDSGGKEAYSSGLTTLVNYSDFDEGEFFYPAKQDESFSQQIAKRTALDLEERRRLKNSSTSIIGSADIKSAIENKFTDHVFSASQFETYARCPYQYFLKKVMGLEPIEPPTPEINRKHRGTIMHLILELFFKNEMDNVLKYMRNEIEFGALENRLDEYVEASMKENSRYTTSTHPALVDYFKKRARAVSLRAIEFEIENLRDMEYALLPAYAEWEFGEKGTPHLILKNPPLKRKAKVTGKVDRIDIDEDHNTFLITDYKSGRTESVTGKIKKGEHLQLPIYIEAARKLLLPDKIPAGAMLFSLRNIEKKHGMALKDMKKYYFSNLKSRIFESEEGFEDLISATLTHAAEYINSIRDARFMEKTSDCERLCDYREICRYGK